MSKSGPVRSPVFGRSDTEDLDSLMHVLTTPAVVFHPEWADSCSQSANKGGNVWRPATRRHAGRDVSEADPCGKGAAGSQNSGNFPRAPFFD